MANVEAEKMLRDKDFEREFPEGISLSENMYQLIIDAVRIDSEYLNEIVKTTDYSLLVGFRLHNTKDFPKLKPFLEDVHVREHIM